MTRLRLIPVVMFAAAALLVIKGLGFVANMQPSRVTTVTAAPAPVAQNVPDTDLEFTSSAPTPKKEEPPKKEETPLPLRAPETPNGINVGVPGDTSPAQKALLERLQQRRQELDAKARDLELRENLIREAEQRLETRLNELRVLENPASAENPADSPKMKNLVIMYENMKPKEAARIFEKLDVTVLVGIAKAMKPPKLSEVLAVMNPDAAQKLTVELARGVSPDRAIPPSDLPRVNMPPAPQKQMPPQAQNQQKQQQTQNQQKQAPTR
ncbi:MAG: flagellar protein FlbB [Xanthobacteraceae bacterium]|nr:flagellar protein FlbB [Xanthobacteraceae bacterium]MCW5675781.1 flagellar protein FlbB [Xanthobacteraceae bacterium]